MERERGQWESWTLKGGWKWDGYASCNQMKHFTLFHLETFFKHDQYRQSNIITCELKKMFPYVMYCHFPRKKNVGLWNNIHQGSKNWASKLESPISRSVFIFSCYKNTPEFEDQLLHSRSLYKHIKKFTATKSALIIDFYKHLEDGASSTHYQNLCINVDTRRPKSFIVQIKYSQAWGLTL